MLQLTTEHHQTIHNILAKGLIGIHGIKGYIGLLQGDPALNISKDEGRFLRGAMEKMGLTKMAYLNSLLKGLALPEAMVAT